MVTEQVKKTGNLELADRQTCDRGFVYQTESARNDEEPGDVRRRSRQRPDDDLFHLRSGQAGDRCNQSQV